MHKENVWCPQPTLSRQLIFSVGYTALLHLPHGGFIAGRVLTTVPRTLSCYRCVFTGGGVLALCCTGLLRGDWGETRRSLVGVEFGSRNDVNEGWVSSGARECPYMEQTSGDTTSIDPGRRHGKARSLSLEPLDTQLQLF